MGTVLVFATTNGGEKTVPIGALVLVVAFVGMELLGMECASA